MTRFACLALAALVLAGCGGGASSDPVLPSHDVPPPVGGVHGANGVDHIVIAIQENRSFDNLFHAFPGADSVSAGKIHTGAMVPLHSVPLAEAYDLPHHFANFMTAFNFGKMNGFDQERNLGGPQYDEYAYVQQSDIQEYWTLAKQYTLADHTFPSQIDASYSA